MGALIEYGTEMNTHHQADSAAARKLRATASARLRLVKHVAKGDDFRIASALSDSFRSSSDSNIWQIRTGVMAKLTGYIPLLISEKRNAGRVISRIKSFYDVSVEEHEDRTREAAKLKEAVVNAPA